MPDKKIKVNITDAEWEIMRVVWTVKETTSKQVAELLNEKKEWKSTTVKTLLSRLVDKGIIGTKKEGNRFIYLPLVEENQSMEHISEEMLAKICSKKVGDVLETMIQTSLLSFSDIDRLEALLEQKRQTAVIEVPCSCIPGQCECHLAS